MAKYEIMTGYKPSGRIHSKTFTARKKAEAVAKERLTEVPGFGVLHVLKDGETVTRFQSRRVRGWREKGTPKRRVEVTKLDGK